MGSTRLPGKVLRRLGSKVVLAHVIERLCRTPGVERVVVATTEAPQDTPLSDLSRGLGVKVTRGPEDDVLRRFVQTFDEHGGTVGIRVTADCPLLDPGIVAAALRAFQSARPAVMYLSNTLERTYPRGYDVEVFDVAALRAADTEARDVAEREHVTPFIYRRPNRFSIAQLTRADPNRTADWRLTLDTADDWELLERVVETLEPVDPGFGLDAVEKLIAKRPELLKLNRHVAQKLL